MWQLIEKFKRPPGVSWYHESSEQAAIEIAWLDNWVLAHIRQDLGDTATFEYNGDTAQATITIVDPERGEEYTNQLKADQTLQEYSIRMYAWSRSMGMEQLAKIDPLDPDSDYQDINESF